MDPGSSPQIAPHTCTYNPCLQFHKPPGSVESLDTVVAVGTLRTDGKKSLWFRFQGFSNKGLEIGRRLLQNSCILGAFEDL